MLKLPLAHLSMRARYVERLAELHAALILVDADAADWRFWATTPKASAATRRIPVLALSVSDARRREALAAGADLTLDKARVAPDLSTLVGQHARLPDPVQRASLADQCNEPLREEARAAIELFNRGEYYAQHDALEALWVEDERPVRDLYRAILQVGVGYYQLERGNRRGAIKMLLRAEQWLQLLPDVCQGVDIAGLREDARRVRAAIEAHLTDTMTGFDQALLRPVRMAADPRVISREGLARLRRLAPEHLEMQAFLVEMLRILIRYGGLSEAMALDLIEGHPQFSRQVEQFPDRLLEEGEFDAAMWLVHGGHWRTSRPELLALRKQYYGELRASVRPPQSEG